MQLFGLDVDPCKSAEESYDTHATKICTEAAQLLYTEAHHRNATWLSKPVPGRDGEEYEPMKPLSKGHKQHPCFFWVCASPHHVWWTLQYALALCKEYSLRNNKPKRPCPDHKTEYHLLHILAHTPKPTSPCTCTVDEFKKYISSLDINSKKPLETIKTCTENPPQGCLFGVLAINTKDIPEPHKTEFDARLAKACNDWVKSYRIYYESKKHTFKKPSVSMRKHGKEFEFKA